MYESLTPERRARIDEYLVHMEEHDRTLGDVFLREALAEVDRLRAELDLAFGPGMYFAIQQVLDKALGTEKSDSAGGGIADDVALVADRMSAAGAENERLRALVAEVSASADRALDGEVTPADAVAEIFRHLTEEGE